MINTVLKSLAYLFGSIGRNEMVWPAISRRSPVTRHVAKSRTREKFSISVLRMRITSAVDSGVPICAVMPCLSMRGGAIAAIPQAVFNAHDQHAIFFEQSIDSAQKFHLRIAGMVLSIPLANPSQNTVGDNQIKTLIRKRQTGRGCLIQMHIPYAFL